MRDYNGTNNPFYGKKHSEDTRARMKESAKYRPRVSDETRKRMSESGKGKKKMSDNPMWKGDSVTYGALHDWLRDNLVEPEECITCGLPKRLELHNISGKYLRDVEDWIWLCRRCHMAVDGRLEQLIIRNKTSF